jgi:hypothetical protein
MNISTQTALLASTDDWLDQFLTVCRDQNRPLTTSEICGNLSHVLSTALETEDLQRDEAIATQYTYAITLAANAIQRLLADDAATVQG